MLAFGRWSAPAYADTAVVRHGWGNPASRGRPRAGDGAERPGRVRLVSRRHTKYVGKAASLRARLWGNHLGQSASLSSSALRRNVALRLGFGTTAALKRREVVLTGEQLAEVRAWLVSCELAWLTCATADDAIALEIRLRKEALPCLNQR